MRYEFKDVTFIDQNILAQINQENLQILYEPSFVRS